MSSMSEDLTMLSGVMITVKVKNKFRVGVFRRWLEDKFGLDTLTSGSGVLDVAGEWKRVLKPLKFRRRKGRAIV